MRNIVILISVVGCIGLAFAYYRLLSVGEASMSVSVDTRLGKHIELNAVTKPLLDFIKTRIAEFDASKTDTRCIAYCTKTNLDSVPVTRQEVLILVCENNPRRYNLILAASSAGVWTELCSPTQIQLEQFESVKIREFLEDTTFGFYDFDVADIEFLYIASSYKIQLSFLCKPLPPARRQGRMGKFVPPGP